jgi:hypothetical protein
MEPLVEPQGRRSKPQRAKLAADVIEWIEQVCIVPEGKWYALSASGALG